MKRALAALLLLTTLSACTGLRFRHQVERGFDYGRLSTYGWDGVEAARSERVATRVRTETDRILQEKGYTPSANPDFRVRVRFVSSVRAGGVGDNVTESGGSFPEEFDMSHTASGYYVGREGEMRVELSDSATGEVFWRGIAAGSLEARMPDAERDRLVTQALTGLLEEFPSRRSDR